MKINEGQTQVRSLEQVARLLLPLAACTPRTDWRLFLAVCQEDGCSQQKLARRLDASWSEVMRGVARLESGEDAGQPGPALLCCTQPNPASARKEVYLTAAGRQLRRGLVESLGEQEYAALSLQAMEVLHQALSEALAADDGEE